MKFAVIGNPISHSLSPLMHHANFQSLNLENTYEAINVPVNQFQDIKNNFRKRALMDSMLLFHKERIIPYLDDINEQAKSVGAVNTVLVKDGKWIGYNTDGIGYVNGLKQIYEGIEDAILILGAGGASKGIANELYKIVRPTLTVANRTMSRLIIGR